MDIQATAVSYKNQAILIQGPANIGKTSFALSLIEKGATLIGDDVVEICQLCSDRLLLIIKNIVIPKPVVPV